MKLNKKKSVSSNLRRSRAGRKKAGAVGPIRKFWRRYHLTKIFLIIGLSASLFVGVYLFALAKSTNVTDLQNALKTRTLIFDREEKEAGALSGQKGTYVELSDISEDLQNAVIATEDRSFYKNDGINYVRFFSSDSDGWTLRWWFYNYSAVGEKCLSFSRSDCTEKGERILFSFGANKKI